MSAADVPGPPIPCGEVRVRDLLRRYAASSDPAERARILAGIADGLVQAVEDIVATDPDSHPREVVARLLGQADMARYLAAVDHATAEREAC